MSHKPYSVFTPPFDIVSGGVRVMYGLYGWLLAKGQIVNLNARYALSNAVAIYPEIYAGNPAEANTVVRYILNKPGVMGGVNSDGTFQPGPTTFDPTDKLYYFSRLFGEAEDDNHYLFLPILDTRLFRDQRMKRTKVAYFVGKGRDPKFIHPEGAILIDRKLAQDQEALANLLNECQVLYCYDPVTAMTEISRLCGCRVVMVNPLYTKQAFSQYEPGMNGISWGEDEGKRLNSSDFRFHYIQMKNDFSLKLDQFIEETQSS